MPLETCSENTQKIITKHNTKMNQYKQPLHIIKLIKQKLHDYKKEGRNIGIINEQNLDQNVMQFHYR